AGGGGYRLLREPGSWSLPDRIAIVMPGDMWASRARNAAPRRALRSVGGGVIARGQSTGAICELHTAGLTRSVHVPRLRDSVVAAPQLHLRAVVGVGAVDVEALVAVGVHEAHVAAAHVLLDERLRAGAVAVIQLRLGAVGGAGAGDVH